MEIRSCQDVCKLAGTDSCPNEDWEEGCREFECNCSKIKFVGSNMHGNYYKCKICGEESES